MRGPVTIRTADVLAAFGAVAPGTPMRQRDIAAVVGVESRAISGHLKHLRQTGQVARVGYGLYVRLARGEAA